LRPGHADDFDALIEAFAQLARDHGELARDIAFEGPFRRDVMSSPSRATTDNACLA
jgi:hypothetical protein